VIKHLIATIGGLEPMTHNNQAKTDYNIKEIIAKMRVWRKEMIAER
jgi:hypothetical protein